MYQCVECNVCKQMYDITTNSQKKNCCNKCYQKEYYKEYYQKNKEKLRQQQKEWHKNNKEKILRSKMIKTWKRRGLICENYDQVYQLWLDSTHCDKCGCQYTDKNVKSMDHCHTTGKFRAIICNRCNMNMLDQTKPINNTSGHKNISYHKVRHQYTYEKKYYGKQIGSKRFKTLSDALCFKYIMLLRIRAGHYN